MYKRYEKKTAWLLDQTKTCHKAQLVRHRAVSEPVSRPNPRPKPPVRVCLCSHTLHSRRRTGRSAPGVACWSALATTPSGVCVWPGWHSGMWRLTGSHQSGTGLKPPRPYNSNRINTRRCTPTRQ